MRLATVVLALVLACGHDDPPAAEPGKLELVGAPAGDVAQIVAAELPRAAAAHQHLVVYVGATWCEPCTRFHDAAEHGELDHELGDLRLLVFDSDRAGRELDAAGYGSRMLPLFALPGPDGTASPRRIEGSIKGSGSPRQIVPRLRALVDGH